MDLEWIVTCFFGSLVAHIVAAMGFFPVLWLLLEMQPVAVSKEVGLLLAIASLSLLISFPCWLGTACKGSYFKWFLAALIVTVAVYCLQIFILEPMQLSQALSHGIQLCISVLFMAIIIDQFSAG